MVLENGFLTELEQLGGDFTSVYGINDAGIAVGESRTNANVRHAVIWRERKIVDLGSLAENGSSAAYGINNIGQVVGTTAVKNSNRFHAFVWQQGGMMDLEDRLPPDSGWELYVARSINDEGQIVGRGSYNGKFADFLMTLPR